jgi:CubicO group peptidase (beta-lactamase class C family)
MRREIPIRGKARFVLVLLAVLASHGSVLPQDPAQQPTARVRQIDELVSLYHKYGQFNGAILVAENGAVIYKKGFGLANMEWNIPNEPDTKFRLGSITKQFTAALILQLAEEGKIKLDAKVSDYLPYYRKDTGSRITIHNLLSHTSGVPNYTAAPGFMQNVSRNPFEVDDFVKKYASGDLEFEPGTKFNYSNSGYFLLGAIIEKVTGKPYEKVLQEKILDPLGMKNTGYDHYGTVLSKRASGYIKTPRGYENASYLDMTIPYAAGSLYSTVEDLFLWDQALYGDKVLSTASKELMFKPNLENYGYGFGIRKATLGANKTEVPVVEHNGGINGFNTIIVRLIGSKKLIVLLDNTSQGRYLDQISLAITNILYDQPYESARQSIAEVLSRTILEKDVASAVNQYRELKATQPRDYDFREEQLNTLGYQLLQMKKVVEAIEIFKLNVAAYPQGSNTYDSLGEAYMVHGDNELAIANYKKSLELNPKNTGATMALERLTARQKLIDQDHELSEALYGDYAGDYELAPNFIITITLENGKLMSQATGQQKAELYSSSPTEFFLKVVDAQITFEKNQDGQVKQLILHQNGRNMPARKIR